MHQKHWRKNCENVTAVLRLRLRPAGAPNSVFGGGIDLKFIFSQSVFSNIDSDIKIHEKNRLWHNFGKSPIYSPLLLLVLVLV